MLRDLLVVILLFISLSSAQEFMLFADDYYKAIGSPQIQVSAVNPFIEAGGVEVLEIIVSNEGKIDALIPTGLSGGGDIKREMLEEMKAADALNVAVELDSAGSLRPLINRASMPILPAGSSVSFEFPVVADFNSSASSELDVHVTYEHQIDAKISGGRAVQLYVPGDASKRISVEVRRGDRLRVLHVDGKLKTNSNSSIDLLIKNRSPLTLKNCTARLIAAYPLRAVQSPQPLGDIMPGELFLIKLRAEAEEKPTLDKYMLSCIIDHDGGSEHLTFPVEISRGLPLIPLVVASTLLALTLLSLRRFRRSSGLRRRTGIGAIIRRLR